LGSTILPGEQKPVDAAQLVKDLGFDSVTSYVWIHHVGLPKQQTDYDTSKRVLQILGRGGAEVLTAVLSKRDDGLGFKPASNQSDSSVIRYRS